MYLGDSFDAGATQSFARGGARGGVRGRSRNVPKEPPPRGAGFLAGPPSRIFAGRGLESPRHAEQRRAFLDTIPEARHTPEVIPLKIVRFALADTVLYGLLEGETIHSLPGRPWEDLDPTGPDYPLADCRLLAPVAPPEIWAIGLNYRAHAQEIEMAAPTAPVVFLKATSSVLGPGDAIRLPALAPDEVDYEAELALVIGRSCHQISEEEALDYLLGSTCGNDVTARDCQFRLDRQWARAKSFETFCPLGPWIETDVDPDQATVSLTLNGQTMQDGNTQDMIFSCRQLITYLSQITTLRPGTVIMTGTPPGVGYKRTPPVFLKQGDVVEVSLEGIGTLRNTVGTSGD